MAVAAAAGRVSKLTMAFSRSRTTVVGATAFWTPTDAGEQAFLTLVGAISGTARGTAQNPSIGALALPALRERRWRHASTRPR